MEHGDFRVNSIIHETLLQKNPSFKIGNINLNDYYRRGFSDPLELRMRAMYASLC